MMGVTGCDEVLPKRTEGEKIYRKHCADCHGLDARGHTVRYMGNHYADLLDDQWRHSGDAHGMEAVLREGTVFLHPSFEELNQQELRKVVDHVLVLRGETRP